MKNLFATALVAAIIAIGSSTASAEVLYGTTVNNTLLSFESTDACSILTEVSISGLQPGEDILGIDFRPSNGELYALGSSSRLYVIDLGSGVAMPVGSGPFSPALEGDSFGFDFNPTVDRIRIISNTGQNLRAVPNIGTAASGTVAFVDGSLAFATGDANEGTAPFAVAAAYTNPDRDTATGTTLYNIDSALDLLVSQNPPNAGTLNTIGGLGVNTNDLAGFDISVTNMGYAALMESGKSRPKGNQCGTSTLSSVNVMTGDVTRLGSIGTRQPIRGLAAYIAP